MVDCWLMINPKWTYLLWLDMEAHFQSTKLNNLINAENRQKVTFPEKNHQKKMVYQGKYSKKQVVSLLDPFL